jgi:NitT/TauT family transport system substrate-binding protein
MKKQNLLLVSIAVLIIALVVVGGILLFIDSQHKTSINIGFKKHVSYLPLFVALERGFFAENKLDVNPVAFDSTNQMMAAVVSGDVQAILGGANIPTVLSVEEKSPGTTKIFNTLEVNENTGITCALVSEDSPIANLNEIEGKNAATAPGTFAVLWIDSALKTAGLGRDDIKLQGIDTKLQLAALESEQIDVLFAIEPECSFAVNKGIGKIIYNEPLKHFGKSLTASVFSVSFENKDPEAIERIIKTSDRAIDFIRQNPQESLAILAKYTDYKPELLAGMKMPEYRKSDELDLEAIQEIADKLYAAGELKKELIAGDIVI